MGRTNLALTTIGVMVLTQLTWAQVPAAPPTAAAPGATTTTAEPAPDAAAEPPEPEGERALGEDEAMVLNFEHADIREVIHSLATALGLSYTIDPRIEGQVTIRTTGKIARKDLFPLFNEILRNNGIAAVRVGELYQMLPVAEAKTRAIAPRSTRDNVRTEDGFVIEIVALRHVAAEEMANILQPFVTPGGDVLAYPRANTVVITDIESNVKRLRELVATFDIDGFTNLHARVFKVKEGDPDELVGELLQLLAPYGVTPTGEGEGGVSLVSLSRLDAIVAFALDRSAFAAIEHWLAILDVPPDQTSGRQTFVYNVENAKAADLAGVLNELFGGEGGAGGGGPGRNPRGQPGGVGLFGAGGAAGGGGGGAFGRGGAGGGGAFGGGGGGRRGGAFGGGSSSLGGGGGVGGANAQGVGGAGGGGSFGGAGGGGRRRGGLGAGGAGAAGQPGQPGAPGQAGQGGQVLGVSLPGGVQAQPGQPAIPGVQTSGPPPVFKEEVRIVADEVTNSLVILATRRDYQLILDVLRRIDVVPRQVVLEVMIAEVVLNKGLEFGVRYAIAEGKLGNVPAGTTVPANPGTDQTNSTTPAPAVTSQQVDGLILQRLFRGAAGSLNPGAFAVISPSNNFQILLTALQSLTDVKMLAAPHIIAADNREAHILVGQSIPILTQTQTSTGIQGTVGAAISQVQYRDTGKILTVLPQVNSQGLVNLQIRQEVSAVLQTAQGAVTSFGNTNSPAFSTREAETTVVVQDGETVLIGGIIDDSISHTRSGIPYLMDIPVLGRAFRSDSDQVDRTELLVTITPSVIRSKDEARRVTDDYSNRIEGLTELRRAMEAQRHRHMHPHPSDEPRDDAPADRR
jgi:general secretion pathway protein D